MLQLWSYLKVLAARIGESNGYGQGVTDYGLLLAIAAAVLLLTQTDAGVAAIHGLVHATGAL